ncbi:Tetratricopeptide repeat protein [Novipirellula artificiosorum]|uniref:Tetratricopeptide repeat protein n=2 Tax=Novipirellula artificiosorum TaxID=2528016 RepID=A0A5C6C842_9BACT|nr:Tetratricopeptide repeat protein [Novipirellula artificiosorum]
MQGLRAAAIFRQLGQHTESDRLAEQSLASASQLWKEQPTSAAIALAVAQNQSFLQRHRDSVKTLDTALKRSKTAEDTKVLRAAMADTIVAWVHYIEASRGESEEYEPQSLQMLQLALQYAPNHPRIFAWILNLDLAATNEDDRQVNSLREAYMKGTSPGMAHFLLGTAALMKDDSETAENHLKLAAETLPHRGAILNNLAVAMATRQGGDLEQALKISEFAVEYTEDPSPHYYETRGQILMKLERYTDAIPDLERALKVESLQRNAHKSLATCYDAIGQKEIAEQHRKAVEAIAQPQPQPK